MARPGLSSENGRHVGDDVAQQGDDRGEGKRGVKVNVKALGGLDPIDDAIEHAVLLHVADDHEQADEQEDEIPIDQREKFSRVLRAGDEHHAGGDQRRDLARDGEEKEGSDEAGGDQEGLGHVPGLRGGHVGIGLKKGRRQRRLMKQAAAKNKRDGQHIEDEAEEDQREDGRAA